MSFHHIFKVLVVAAEIAERTPMRLHGAAILRQLREKHSVNVTLVTNTRDALTEVERDASVATVLVEWGDAASAIDAGKIVARMREIGLEAPVFVIVSNRDDLPAVRQLLTEEITGFILTDEDTPEF